MLHDPVPDIWLWVAFWIGITLLPAVWGGDAPAPAATGANPSLRAAHGISALGIVAMQQQQKTRDPAATQTQEARKRPFDFPLD